MFHKIKLIVAERFKYLQSKNLLCADIESGVLYKAYLDALPDEERQAHTCNKCRSFFDNYGNIVAIVDGKIETLWDFGIAGLYSEVPKALHDIVSNSRILSTFNTSIAHLGTDYNDQFIDGHSIRWEHFYLELSEYRVFRPSPVFRTVRSLTSENTNTRNVFSRGLKEISLEACQSVLDLIDHNSLYRGAEFRDDLIGFIALKLKYNDLPSEAARHLFSWENYGLRGSRIRNTAIGTLLINLSDGVEIDSAVESYETIVAPANYQRPTRLVTPRMIASAEQAIVSMGYSKSLERRHATIDDVKVTDLLYVNRSSDDDVGAFESLKLKVNVDLTTLRYKTVNLQEFLEIAAKSTLVSLLIEPSHTFVSLIAPKYDDAKLMFKWGNAFSWMYQNNLTDSIKLRVKEAGGRIDAELRISLEWFNYDDLDLHVIEPDGDKISFFLPRSRYSSGFLDVDMNAGQATTRTPVENIAFTWPEISPGLYKVQVHNYRKRENVDFGFNLQIECRDVKHDLSYSGAVGDRCFVDAATFTYDPKSGLSNLETRLKNTQPSVKFGVMTGRWQKVSAIMWSPNYWGDNRVGNRHLMVMLKDARIDTPVRPFSNEYLESDLHAQRRVFELLSDRLQIQPSEHQFAGVGFSVTQNPSFIARVDGAVYKVSVTV